MTSPGTKKREANFTAGVEVWVESDFTWAGCWQVHFRWAVGVVVVDEDIVHVGTMCIRGSFCTHNHSLHNIDSLRVNSNKNGIGMLDWEGGGHISEFLGETDKLALRRGVVIWYRASIVMLIAGAVFKWNISETEVTQPNTISLRKRLLKNFLRHILLMVVHVTVNGFLHDSIRLDDGLSDFLTGFLLLI